MGAIEADKRNYAGRNELRHYALEKYGKLPFIIELHDTPLYSTFYQNNPNVLYGLIYPNLNNKLGKIIAEFEKYSKNKQVFLAAHEIKGAPGYHSATIEFFPTHFNAKTGSFYTLDVKDAESFSRNVIEYFKKKI